MDFFRFPVQRSKVYLYDLFCFLIDYLVVMMYYLWWNGTFGISFAAVGLAEENAGFVFEEECSD